MPAMSNYLCDQVKTAVLLGGTLPLYDDLVLRLFTTPLDGSGTATEVSGGSYAPASITFTGVSTGLVQNTNLATFTNMPACTIVAVGVYGTDNAATPTQHLLLYGVLTPSRTIVAGDSFAFGIDSLMVQWQ